MLSQSRRSFAPTVHGDGAKTWRRARCRGPAWLCFMDAHGRVRGARASQFSGWEPSVEERRAARRPPGRSRDFGRSRNSNQRRSRNFNQVQVEEDRARRARTRAERSVEERRKSRPFLACRNPVRRAREILAYFAFQRARRAAWCRLQEGESDVGFPLGTYRVWGIVLTKPRTSSCGLVPA